MLSVSPSPSLDDDRSVDGHASWEPPTGILPAVAGVPNHGHASIPGLLHEQADKIAPAVSYHTILSGEVDGCSNRVLATCITSVDLLRLEGEAKILSSHVPSHSEEDDVEQQQAQVLREALLVALQWPLCLCGAVPFGRGRTSTWYCAAAALLVAGLFLHTLVLAALEPQLLYQHLVAACHALGCLLGLVLLHAGGIGRLLGPHNRPLQAHARDSGFVARWAQVSARRLAVAGAAWALAAGCKLAEFLVPGCVGADEQARELESPVSVVTFVVVAGIFAALAFLQLHVCCGLELTVDAFCVRFVQGMEYGQAVVQWGVVQALLRRAAGTIDACLLAQGTAVLVTLLLAGIRVLQGQPAPGEPAGLRGFLDAGGRCAAPGAGWLRWGWLLSPAALLLYTMFRAAAVSEKCSRVPPFVNAWDLEAHPIDHDREYASRHIAASMAGFYVRGVRLTGPLALKLSYLLGVVFFTLLTKDVLTR